ncbi:hypothetical protein VPCG_00001 [Vibrio phage martha 12B12]|uniref:tail fiber protein n=1 Tax=Vibrio phage martha 12B12 TaxID=573175 RepID=UPI0002C04436|nr:tail fiber protein [Vibrio phage martha 12B12]AGG58112.1 hypothetical protein VPCG_00001 [Vibrio phage martha 12B12]
MHPLQNGSQDTNRPPKKPLTGSPGWFTESGDNNVPSYPGADWFNHVIAEFQNMLASQGIAFNPDSDDHLSKAFLGAFANKETVFLSTEDMVTGTNFNGKSVTHEIGNIYKTFNNGTFNHWKVTAETANGFTKVALGQSLTASMLRTNGENLAHPPQQATTYAEPISRFVYGLEYTFAITKGFSSKSRTLKFIHSGDSTTAGDAAEGFPPAVVMANYGEDYGLYQTQLNRGHSGQDTVRWNQQYVSEDIDDHGDMDCYIVRWGINDGSSHGDPEIFEAALRQGLQKLRNHRSYDELTIVLMSPNSTYDTPNGRDSQWYESISLSIKNAARDFQCVYFDTYGLFRDSYHGAGVYMDDPFGDGRGIHPKKEFNTAIYSYLANLLFSLPAGLRANSNRVSNIPSFMNMPNFNTPLENYHHGISIYRATLDEGWPLDGSVTTERTADNVYYQRLVEYQSGSPRRIYTRIGAGVDSSVSPWRKFGLISLDYATDWGELSDFEPLRLHMSGQLVTLTGGATWTGSGEPGANAKVSLIPADLRPANNVQFIAKTQRGLTFYHTMVSISPNGDVIVQSPESGELVFFSMSWNPADTI